MYNAKMLLDSYYTTCNGSEYILVTFNIRTWKMIHIIRVYKSHFSFISMFLNTLEVLIQKSPNDCPLIVLGDFNIDILNVNNHKKNKQQLIDFMNKLN
jgi:endonuclease/exonuclease/phosphatase family metal-dependent hydrolase